MKATADLTDIKSSLCQILSLSVLIWPLIILRLVLYSVYVPLPGDPRTRSEFFFVRNIAEGRTFVIFIPQISHFSNMNRMGL